MSENLVKHGVKTPIIDEQGNIYPSLTALSKHINRHHSFFDHVFKRGESFEYEGHTYRLKNIKEMQEDGNKKVIIIQNDEPKENAEENQEFQEFLKYKEAVSLPFEKYEIKSNGHNNGVRYAIALFSDAHIEETVNPESVLGLNAYDIRIAEERITKYFANLASCLNRDRIEELIFASLGDTISGFIHEELAQTNGLTPIESTLKGQSLILSGLQYLCKSTGIKKIVFVGIVGNHSRLTKKIQHNNGFKMSLEYIMYQNIKTMANMMELPIEFVIPESEMAVLDVYGKRYLFMHGFQIRGSHSGTVCGIYPSLNRLSMKLDRTFHQNKLFLGHFHSCTSIPNATVNGSIIGYNSFALTNGFPYEAPAQMYEAYDSNMGGGELLTRKIYCE